MRALPAGDVGAVVEASALGVGWGGVALPGHGALVAGSRD